MAGTPVTSCARMTVPIPGFSAAHEAPESFPTVTTFSATSTWATPGNANNRSARGEPAANSLAGKKKGPPGCTVRLTVNLHVSGSATEVSARIVIVASTGRTSDIFHDLGCVALSEGPQVLERVDPGTVAVVPAESDGVIASAGDRAWGHVRQHALWIEERPSAHFLDAAGARACQSKVPDVEVVTVPVLPEHRQRARISPAETDGGGLGTRRPDSALYPGRLTLVGFPGPRERLQHRCWESLESASEFRGDSEVGLGCEGGRLLEHDRTPFVPARDDVGVERNRAQERDAELPTHPLAAAAAEDVCALSTVRARKRSPQVRLEARGAVMYIDGSIVERGERLVREGPPHLLQRQYVSGMAHVLVRRAVRGHPFSDEARLFVIRGQIRGV